MTLRRRTKVGTSVMAGVELFLVSGQLTDDRVLFQSGTPTSRIISQSILWAPRRRTRTLTTGQKVKRLRGAGEEKHAYLEHTSVLI